MKEQQLIIILSILVLILLCSFFIFIYFRHIHRSSRVHDINNILNTQDHIELRLYHNTILSIQNSDNIERSISDVISINNQIRNIEYSYNVTSPTPDVINDNSSVSSLHSILSSEEYSSHQSVYEHLSSDSENNIIDIDLYSEELSNYSDEEYIIHSRIDSDIENLILEDVDLNKYVLSFEYYYKGIIRRCNICLEDIYDGHLVKQTSCLHIYHLKCLDTWHGYNQVCPECRMPTII